MEKVKDKATTLRPSAQDLFNTVDDLLENGNLTKDDREWLEKELEEMEKKLKAYKQAYRKKAALS